MVTVVFLKQAIIVSFLLNASSLDCGYIELKEDLYRLESAMLAAAFGMLGLVLKFWHTYKRAETKILGPENWFFLFGGYCVEVWGQKWSRANETGTVSFNETKSMNLWRKTRERNGLVPS